jgi:KDO2-lipid IV(A) lauroyltransferase
VSLLHVGEYAAVRLAVMLATLLPAEPLRRLAARVARFVFDRGGRRTGWALTNLRIAFPDASEETLHHIGRESYAHFAWNALDFLRSGRWSDAELLSRVSFNGLEHVDVALSEGKGLFGLTLHLGNFELGPLAICAAGHPASGVARTMQNRLLYDYVIRRRSSNGNEVIDRRKAAPGILRALKRGRLVGILNDQYSRRTRAVFAPLFGARCSTSAGLATLALRSRAPILPMYIVRDGPEHHTATIEPPIALPDSGDRGADILELTTRCNAALEAIIRKHPEQWMWGHRRFRHSPDLPGDLYP